MIDLKLLKESLSVDSATIRREKRPLEKGGWDVDNMLDAMTIVGQSIIPEFVIDSNNKGVYTSLAYWMMGDMMPCTDPVTHKRKKGRLDKGIYLYGTTGTGKTLAIQVLRKCCYTFGLKYKLGDEIRSLDWTTVRTDALTDAFCHGGSIEEFKTKPVVCFNDLGSEPTDAVYMGNRVNVMKNILEARGDLRSTLTIITSNIPLDHPDLKAMYGDRVVSRLYDMCDFLVLKGKDRRL